MIALNRPISVYKLNVHVCFPLDYTKLILQVNKDVDLTILLLIITCVIISFPRFVQVCCWVEAEESQAEGDAGYRRLE